MTTTHPRDLRPGRVQDHHPRAVAGRRRRMAPLGPVPRHLARSGHRGDDRPGRDHDGLRVLDVAAGAGEQSLRIAERVGPDGHVLATDIAPEPARPRRRATRPPRACPRWRPASSTARSSRPCPPASFDAVVSRVGLIYFPDQQRALRGMLHALRPGRPGVGGRLLDARGQRVLLDPGRHHPGPRRAAAAAAGPARAVLARGARRAGRDARARRLHATSRSAPCPRRCELPSAAECVRFERESFGALHQMMRSLSEAEQAETWARDRGGAGQFESESGFSGPCEMLVGAGSR